MKNYYLAVISTIAVGTLQSMVSMTTYNHDGREHFLRQERFFHYKLDEHHNPVEITSSQCTCPKEEKGEKRNSDGIPIYFEYEYDAQGNWTSKKSDQNGRTTYTNRNVIYFE